MSINLDKLSAKELGTLINKAKKRKTKLAKRKSAASVRNKVNKLLKAEDYTLAELFGGTSAAPATRARKSTAGRKIGKVAPKYRNPANASETWTGRGRQPRWMAAETAKGKQPEDFLIKK